MSILIWFAMMQIAAGLMSLLFACILVVLHGPDAEPYRRRFIGLLLSSCASSLAGIALIALVSFLR